MKLTHINKEGYSKMISIVNKKITFREAIAYGQIKISKKLLNIIISDSVPKGNVFNTARVAGILGIKKTSTLIPMCHSLLIENIKINFNINSIKKIIECKCEVNITGKTGVEMEALLGVSISLLTIYDMCKSIDKKMSIENIKLIKKIGGKSGEYIRKVK